ncbi:MAG: hemerythrin family protein [Desulfatitalea sp.]|nr:hemerythrin family protein [Desulfatitalea sp.]
MQWKPIYSIGIDKIDNQHRRLIQMATQLEGAVAEQSFTSKMGNTLRFLVDYTSYHFKNEEELMEQIQYSELNEHKALHKQLMTDVRQILMDLRNGKTISGVDLVNFLKNWIVAHIEKEDQKIGIEMEKIRNASAKEDLPIESIVNSPTHELKKCLEKLLSLLDGELISQQDFESHKNELLAKFVSRFAPQYTIEIIEEYKALHSLLEQGLVNAEDENRIISEFRDKIDYAHVLSNDTSLEDSLAHLKILNDIKLLADEAYSLYKRDLLVRISA